MINRYNDLAANERTYFAWLRTALSLIAFGFVLERFDLFLRTIATSFAGNGRGPLSPISPIPPKSLIGSESGIVLVAVGIATIVMATWRFSKTTAMIRSEKLESYSSRSPLVLGVVFMLLSIFVLLYVARLLF